MYESEVYKNAMEYSKKIVEARVQIQLSKCWWRFFRPIMKITNLHNLKAYMSIVNNSFSKNIS